MVEVSPIRTGQDHEAALAEIEALMSARPGTPDGDRLDVLATLVHAYEAEHDAIEAPPATPLAGSDDSDDDDAN